MRRGVVIGWFLALIFAVISIVLLALLAQEKQTTQALALVLSATKTPMPTNTYTPTFTPTNTFTPTFTASPTNVPTDTPTATPALTSGAWILDNRKSALDDTITAFISLRSDETVSNGIRSDYGYLIISCQKQGVNMLVTSGMQLDYDLTTKQSPIRIRFDKEPQDSVMGDISNSHDAIFVSLNSLKSVVDRMKTHSKLAVGIHSYNGTLLEMVFTIDGFEKSLNGALSVCK